MSNVIQSIYPFLTNTEKDEILSLHEKKHTINSIAAAVSDVKQNQVSEQAILESIAIGYLDEGDSLSAEALIKDHLERHPNAFLHNLLLRCLLSSPNDILQEYYDESLNWARLYEVPLTKRKDRSLSNTLTVGFCCNYVDTVFGETAIFPLLESFSLSGVQTYLYNFSISPVGWDTYALQQEAADKVVFRHVRELNVEQLCLQIEEDKIEVLFDLNGRLREDNRLEVFFSQPAPIQINYFNLVGTTGMKSFGYAIADSVTVPESEESFYTEKIIRLPCGVNGAFHMRRTIAISDLPVIRNGYITFASFNAFFKFNDSVLVCWSKILASVPGSKILIKNQDVSRLRVRKKIYAIFESYGIEKNRIMLEGFTPLEVMKTRYASVDIALDTYPYSGGSTTLNALWQGIPTLTFQGKGWRSNTAASMLKSAKLEALVTHSEEEYIQKAVELATNVSLLKEIREFLEQNVNNIPYFRPDIVYPELVNALKEIRNSCFP